MLGYMYGWMTTAAVVLLFLAAVMISPVRIRGEFSRTGSDDDMEFVVRALFGLVCYRKRIPVLRFVGTGVDMKLDNEETRIADQKQYSVMDRIDPERIAEMMKNVKERLARTDDLTGWTRQMLRKIKLKEWKWSTTVGVNDAMWTAMVTGMLWSLKTTSIGVISQLVRLTSAPQLTVEPDYGKAQFSTRWSCIAQISFGYAILAGLQLLFRMKRSKGGVKLWQNILFRA